jgi:hypothetical protein
MYVCMHACEFANSSKTRPNSDYKIENEVHMTTDIVHVNGLRNLMSLTYANSREIMVQCEYTRIYQYGCSVLVKNRTEHAVSRGFWPTSERLGMPV